CRNRGVHEGVVMRGVHLFPALSFTPYGLEPAWGGTRRLDFVEGEFGKPTWTVWLCHYRESAGAAAHVHVGTAPRGRFDEAVGLGIPGRALAFPLRRELAFAAANSLWGLILAECPESGGGSGRRLDSRQVAQAVEDAADAYRSWPGTSWLVDGQAVQARVWTHGSVWAGFAEGPGDAYVLALGSGVEPGSLSVRSIADSAAYGFDRSLPLDPHAGEPCDRPFFTAADC
ncbi:MAG: hypothetical protein ACYCU5_04110, partial [Actinomycetes bacterium]